MENTTKIIETHNSMQFGNSTTFLIESATQDKLVDLVVHALKWVIRNQWGCRVDYDPYTQGLPKVDYTRCGEPQDNLKNLDSFMRKINNIEDGNEVSLTMWHKW